MQRTRHCNVIGLGYIGLPTATLLASRGYQVYGIDVNAEAVVSINAGIAHIKETNLCGMLKSVVTSGKLKATVEYVSADIHIITVPTPITEDNRPDLSYVKNAFSKLSTVIKQGDLIILESTSPVGTTRDMVELLCNLRPDLQFPTVNKAGDVYICYCPERVLPGRILEELLSNDRLIGGVSPACSHMGKAFYESFIDGECHITTSETAELAKLSENAYRDTNIAFANELSMICDQFSIDPHELIRLTNHHPRVNILKPGVGVGGHCIAVDPWFIVDSAPKFANLIRRAREVNLKKTEYVLSKIMQYVNENQVTTIACFGITFKPDVDDVRESPAIQIVNSLCHQLKSEIVIVEPNLHSLPSQLSRFDNVKLCSKQEALECASLVLGLVAHREFKSISSCDLMNKKIFDFSEVFDHLCVASPVISDDLIPLS